jgi:hypothetical protein
MILVWSAFE